MKLTHSQYESLRSYPESPTQRVVWRAGGFDERLIARGLLRREGEGVAMTDEGRAALAAYRTRYGVTV